ncbi:hypothetical protein Anapl_12246 [Anas platyrhynchos]|uniref:Uncharacterized protein n=1 Tax=Anas platyrhynchos TaxID=8839 RepID=R0LJY5_ANAPL|nr:hypothetical protein Anapl_12246 [Anas platyrhynchos]
MRAGFVPGALHLPDLVAPACLCSCPPSPCPVFASFLLSLTSICSASRSPADRLLPAGSVLMNAVPRPAPPAFALLLHECISSALCFSGWRLALPSAADGTGCLPPAPRPSCPGAAVEGKTLSRNSAAETQVFFCFCFCFCFFFFISRADCVTAPQPRRDLLLSNHSPHTRGHPSGSRAGLGTMSNHGAVAALLQDCKRALDTLLSAKADTHEEEEQQYQQCQDESQETTGFRGREWAVGCGQAGESSPLCCGTGGGPFLFVSFS